MKKKKEIDDFSYEDFEISEEIVEDFNYYYEEDENDRLNRKLKMKSRIIFTSFFTLILFIFITILGAVQMFTYQTTKVVNKTFIQRAEIIKSTEDAFELCTKYYYLTGNEPTGEFMVIYNLKDDVAKKKEKQKEFEKIYNDFNAFNKKMRIELDRDVEGNKLYFEYLRQLSNVFNVVHNSSNSLFAKENDEFLKEFDKQKEELKLTFYDSDTTDNKIYSEADELIKIYNNCLKMIK